MEYVIPLELRRSDAVLLVKNGVVVLELKGTASPTRPDVDQAAAYARDLRAYHRECDKSPVHAVVVPTRARGLREQRDGVWVCSPELLDELVAELTAGDVDRLISLDEFLDRDAFRPLPTLIQAARELFFHGRIPRVWRADASTEPAVEYIARIAREASRTGTRHLVLVTGSPGAGKTLVGMRAVHAHYLDDLAVPRGDGSRNLPAVFLSGNQPLVAVLQHILKGAGGDGKTFVRHIKAYLDRYVPRNDRTPPEHLIVFDEAQRAFSPDKVREVHGKWPDSLVASEPSLFIKLCERLPSWSVLVGLIGEGQHIYLGEEGGLGQWRSAVEASDRASDWTVHAPALIEEVFQGSEIRTNWAPELHLNLQLRFHTADRWHDTVAQLLSDRPESATQVAENIGSEYLGGRDAFRVWLTRDLDVAKTYLKNRYSEAPKARFGLLASSRDTVLQTFGVPNGFLQYSRIRVGPWFADGADEVGSCRHLATCLTEFQCQGLELDMTLLAWGSDLIRERGRWSSRLARKFVKKGAVAAKDPHALRMNSYRVLLTRGRDGVVVYVPMHPLLDETYVYLEACGFRELELDLGLASKTRP